MSENQTEKSAILQELGQIKSDVGQLKSEIRQIKEGQTDLQTKVASIGTWQKALTAGIAIAIGMAVFLHNEQNDRITRVEERIVSRLENIFANQPTTACQCEKEN